MRSRIGQHHNQRFWEPIREEDLCSCTVRGTPGCRLPGCRFSTFRASFTTLRCIVIVSEARVASSLCTFAEATLGVGGKQNPAGIIASIF